MGSTPAWGIRTYGGISRRTSLRNWRETVGVQVPLSAYIASIAQLAEHVTLNHQVLGSIPSGCICERSSVGRAQPCQG